MDINKASDLLRGLDISFQYENLNIKVDFISVYPFQSGESFDSHSHSNYEFHYIKEGKGTVLLQNEEYELNGGCFYLTGPGVVHRQIADEEFPMVEYALKCSIALNNSEKNTGDFSKVELSYVMEVLNNHGNRVVKDISGLDWLFEKVFEEIYYKKLGYFSAIKSTIFEIILFSVRCYTNGTLEEYHIPLKDLDSYRFETLRSYINDNITKNVTRQELASHIRLSIRQTDRIIRAQSGLAIHDFIVREKIISSKRLLSTTELNLAAIAELTGFSSEYHLSRSFKKQVGLTPSEYRRSREIEVKN